MMMKRIIAFLIIIALFIIPVSVFADIPIPDPPYGAYDYWVVVHGTIGKIFLLTSPNPITAPQSGKQMHLHGGYRVYYLEGSYWSYDKEGLSGLSVPIDDIYASNHDIAYSDGSGFFFTLPRVSALFQALKIMDFGTILRTFSAGLIPLVGLIVLVICFRKGWGFLRNQLMH